MQVLSKLNNLRIYDDFFYNQKLDFLTKFNLINNLAQKNITKITLNFIFYGIRVNYKSKMCFNKLA